MFVQKKTDLPRWPGNTPEWAQSLQKYRQRIVGVKAHWHGRQRNFLYLVDALLLGGEGGGGNLTVECIRRTLNGLSQHHPLPPVLYLQMDNASENKNKVVFAFLHHLVLAGVFQKVKVGFLCVGHTHEDIGGWCCALFIAWG